MAGHTFFGKRKLCYTDVLDYTDYQGIGRDPLYKRYDSVYSVIKSVVQPEFRHFLAVPQYIDDEDQICWHVDEWKEYPIKLTDLSGEERAKYEAIKEDTVRHYRTAAAELDGESLQILGNAIKYIDDNNIYCADGKVYLVAWGMTPDVNRHNAQGSIIHEYDDQKRYRITFDEGEHGVLGIKTEKKLLKQDGTILSEDDVPAIVQNDGWLFVGWNPNPVGYVVNGNVTFTAEYKQEDIPVPPLVPLEEKDEEEDLSFDCTFDAGEHGKIDGAAIIHKLANTHLSLDEIPTVKPNKKFEFIGWSPSPENCLVDENKHFVAQYKEILPWYRRWWLWLTGRGCLKWLLWLLLLSLAIWLFSYLLHSCKGCSSHPESEGVEVVDDHHKSEKKIRDDNGYTRPITGDDGVLPDDDMIVAPITDNDGVEPHIIEQPGMPDVISNRLFLFMESEDGDIDALARDFKQAYPGDNYSIIGYDREVKLLVIQIPEGERDQIRKTINDKLSKHRFIVFDEEVYELQGNPNSSTQDKGWHLSAIHLKQGWDITQGSPDITIAIVDDGIEADHPMFKGRIVNAYNVFTQNASLSIGVGHGTHTAGLAAGSTEYFNDGAAGVAPKCKIMPVQVFDNGRCPLSAMVAGVMYALHHDADVVNISIAPSFKGLNVLPVEDQNEIAQSQFHNVAALWSRVCKLAEQKRCILVFAAGNDDILTSIPPENRNKSSIVVTAVDKNMYPTEFTNYGPCSDVSAPGKDIYSSFPSKTFQMCDGTSMAAPIVTGTIALMKTLKKDITVEQARNVLYSTGADVYGWIPPMVLVDKALEATKRGDFKRVERTMRSVPDGVDVHLNSGDVPDVVDREIVTPPQPVPPKPGGETDYDAIRKKIAEYKKKIEELEKLLPNK